ncbi:hypothetical protein KGF56_000188 [Candida oxycetoniae]|uniref:Thiaminase-2/PQQC domain-containing protein n=1 Tax=Candida oxycetoniae TaxID=497107 RepID=A0AAI9WZY3_9ASCO|nr:uncharacterized protein KGF56_000188 [Candida oxycetoniae]KAI3406896.1 hypothetical protein KGF56_000188 [Candida oxycetoniae]
MEKLIQDNYDLYTKAISQPLTNELCQGTLSNSRLYTYLVQDLKFFEFSLNLIGKTLSLCDDPGASIRLAKQIGWLADDENTYFRETLAELEKDNDLSSVIPKMRNDNGITLPAVTKYIEYLEYMIHESKTYIELITLCYTMEKIYLAWVEYNQERGTIVANLAPKFQTWIDLHSGEHFIEWVDFLQREVERSITSEEKEKINHDTFVKTVGLEIDFFESCYNYKE